MGRKRRIAQRVLALIVIALALIIAGCGGGGGTTVANQGPQSFILSSPQTITMGPNSTLDVHVGLVGMNGFSGTVQVTIAGLPAGVSTSQNSFTISGTGGTVTLNTSANVALGSSNLTFQGTSGSLSSSSTTSLSIASFISFVISPGVSAPQTIHDGGSLAVSIGVNFGNSPAPNGAQNYAVQLALSGLSTGVTGSFSQNPVSPGHSTTLTLTATANAPLASGVTVKVIGTRPNDGQQQSGNLTLNVTFPIGQLPNNRTDFIPTDATPAALVYDRLHQLIFASLTDLNRVAAISLASKQIVAQIPVSAPGGLSLSPDNHQLLVGSWTKVVSWIDTDSLQVIRRAVVPSPNNLNGDNSAISPVQAIQAANGKVLLLPWVDVVDAPFGFNGPIRLMEWDPVTNINKQIAMVGDWIWATNADHSVITIDGPSVTVYDSATDSVTTIPVGAFFPTPNPAGTQIAMIVGSPLQFYDKNGTLLGSVDIGQPGSGTFDLIDSGGAFSPDGTLLYVVVPGPVPRLVTVDAVHYQVVRVAPAFYTQARGFFFPPAVVQAADGTGLAFAIGNHGVVLEDSSTAVPFSASTQSLLSMLVVTPDETALNKTVDTTISTQAFTDLPDVYFGAVRGTAQLVPPFVHVTAPPSSIAGPVNVKVLTGDGNSQMIPQAFSYGVTPVLFADMAAPPGGGVPFDLFAYGIDPGAPNTLPQIAIGGNPVTVQKTVQVASEIAYPFALEHAIISVPSGSTGVHDVSFTSSAGSATVKGRFHYLSSVTDFSFPLGATENCVIQDVTRNQLYFAGGSSVLVFSLTSHSFLPSYNVPFLHAGVPVAASGLSLTPDGTHLVTANFGDSSISVIDLNNPAQSVAVAIPTDGAGTLLDAEPFQVAATSKNTVFVNTAVTGLTGGSGAIYQVDLATHAVTRRTDIPENLEASGNFMAVSGDGNAVAVAVPNTSGGNLMVWHAATDQWSGYQEQGQFWRDIAIARDGNKIAATLDTDVSNFPFPILYDPQLNSIARIDYSDLDAVDNGRGLLFDQTGALLYSPTPGVGVDILDAHTGTLRERVRLSESPSNHLQSTVVTPAGDEFIFITGTGFTEVRLDSVPFAIGSVTPVTAASGTQTTLRGTGFTPGTKVIVGGTSVAVTLVDASTLTFFIPSLPAGPARIVLSNPDGSTYVRDAALIVE